MTTTEERVTSPTGSGTRSIATSYPASSTLYHGPESSPRHSGGQTVADGDESDTADGAEDGVRPREVQVFAEFALAGSGSAGKGGRTDTIGN